MASRLHGRQACAAPGRRALLLGAALFTLGLWAAPAAEAAPPAARVDDRGTDADQRACTPDVFRLCMSEIPNEPRIVACLIRSKPRLSPACRLVFERAARSTRHAQVAPRQAAPRQAAPRRAVARKSAKPARMKTAGTGRRAIR